MKKCYIIPKENCSCDCTFCISKSRDYKNKLISKEEEPFLKSANEILATLKLRGIKLFEITGGGEPFLDKNLDKRVTQIKNIIPESYIKIYTNGNHLKYIPGIDEINISVAHYDDEINKKIMKPNVYVTLMNKLLFFRTNYPNIKIRLSIPLLKEGINKEEDIKKLIELTENFDVDYVIRTIYPNTPNYQDNYVDVNYSHPRIKFERDNDVKNFDEIIWWRDDGLYADWSLQRNKHLFSYLLLKPDACVYFDEILNMIENKGYAYYARMYKDINKIMYLYRDKPVSYQKIIENHLKVLSILFGPEFVLLFINNFSKDLSIEECVIETNDLRNEIRNEYSFFHRHNGTVNYNDDTVQTNIVHSPDSASVSFDRDLDFLDALEYQIPTEEKLILARKYRTFKI